MLSPNEVKNLMVKRLPHLPFGADKAFTDLLLKAYQAGLLDGIQSASVPGYDAVEEYEDKWGKA